MLIGAKTANRGVMVQSVLIFDETLLRLLQRLFGHYDSTQCLCPGGLPALRRRFEFALSRLGAERIGLTMGSLRPGGATSLFESGADLTEIQHRGRWDCLRTLGHYIQSANATLAFARLSADSVALTRRVGSHFEVLVGGL